MKSIAFIINPIAGTNLRVLSEKIILKFFSEQEYDLQIFTTTHAGHASEIAKQLVAENIDIIAVAGGDGSVNEVGSVLRGTPTALGIVPIGSGNGLAHHLKIPFNIEKALQLIKKGYHIPVDIGLARCETFGEKCFFSNCGFGFDSETIHAYDDTKMRGIFTYLIMMIRSFATLNPKGVHIKFKGFNKFLHPFVFTVANSSQYGYKIAAVPTASVTDGYLDTLLIPETTFFRILRYAIYSLSNQPKAVKQVAEYYQAKEIEVKFEKETKFQIDGEPFLVNGKLVISIDPKAIQIIVAE